MARGKFKGSGIKRDGRTFVALPTVVLDSPGYRALSHTARSLLVDIARQYTGHNNGKLVACAKYLAPMGWKSNNTVQNALQQLLACGLVVETRKGGFPNTAAWYALAWCDLDQGEALDINPAQYRRGGYLQPPEVPAPTSRTAKATQARRVAAQQRRQKADEALTPSHGSRKLAAVPSSGARTSNPAPSNGSIPAPEAPCPTPSHGAYLETPSPPGRAAGRGVQAGISPSLAAALKRTAAGSIR